MEGRWWVGFKWDVSTRYCSIVLGYDSSISRKHGNATYLNHILERFASQLYVVVYVISFPFSTCEFLHPSKSQAGV